MFVCICQGVSDKSIENSIENGATTLSQLRLELNVGTQCGKCCRCTQKILDKKLTSIGNSRTEAA